MLLRVAGPLVPQMIPNWASSCNSRWLNASQGQITVISARNGRTRKPPSPSGEPLLSKDILQAETPHSSCLFSVPVTWALSRMQLRKDQTTCLINPLLLMGSDIPRIGPPDISFGFILHPPWRSDPRLLAGAAYGGAGQSTITKGKEVEF